MIMEEMEPLMREGIEIKTDGSNQAEIAKVRKTQKKKHTTVYTMDMIGRDRLNYSVWEGTQCNRSQTGIPDAAALSKKISFPRNKSGKISNFH